MPGLVTKAAMPLPSMKSRRNSNAPAVQASGSPPKEVRFLTGSSLASASRERTELEAWSFYYFETHCRECRQCWDPYAVYRRGDSLCQKGVSLARDMAVHVYMRDGEIYERTSSTYKHPDRVEIPHNYHNMKGQLKVTERRARSRSHPVIVGVDQPTSRRLDERRREDKYYQHRSKNETPRSEKKHETEKRHENSRHQERAAIVIETPYSSRRTHEEEEEEEEEEGTRRRRHHRHSSEHRRDDSSVKERRSKYYVYETKPTREDNKYYREDTHTRERRYAKEAGHDIEVETSVRDKKYRTETRKPDKERRKSYYH